MKMYKAPRVGLESVQPAGMSNPQHTVSIFGYTSNALGAKRVCVSWIVVECEDRVFRPVDAGKSAYTDPESSLPI
jgi:hypothetical protein